jgi:hypothetical protein
MTNVPQASVPSNRIPRLFYDMQDALNKVQYLIDFMNKRGLLEEGGFCFPDGDIWYASDN